MREIIDKYYTFTLAFIALLSAMYIFRDNKELVYTICGIFGGLIANPILSSKDKKVETKSDTTSPPLSQTTQDIINNINKQV